jgi:very-short-patch-repair endonuclease
VELLAQHIKDLLEIEVVREHRFHHTRKWRFDLALVGKRVGVEIDGGSFKSGRHSRGAGQRSDMEKYGEALKLGWIVVRCMPEHVRSGQALSWVEAAVNLRGTLGEAGVISSRW